MKERVLSILDDKYEALDLITINDLLGLTTPEELKELEDALNELVADYTVYLTKKNRYILLKNTKTLKIGTLSVNKKGFGFVILPKEEDIYIASDNLNGAIHDDIVLCEITNMHDNEGRIVKVIKRDLKNLVGEIVLINKKLAFKLDDDKKQLKINLTKESLANCVEGHKVVVRVLKKINNHEYTGEVIKILGHKNDPGVDILSIASNYNISADFGPDVEKELESIPDEVDANDLEGRKDLTAKEIFTIDGDDTKDIDDAISLEITPDGIYHLGVHIADVSNYVKENTALGDAAYERGTSHYLADTVIPMLPHKLSNGICSLNEGVVRLTLSCEMEIDKRGKILSSLIFPSYIKSRKKMTYKKVNDILMRNIVDEEYAPFKDTLIKMNELAHILRKEKESRGYIDFGSEEAKIVQDETGKAIDIKKVTREDGENLIEDFMIAANEAVADYIYNMDLPFIYRVHDKPREEKVNDFLSLISILGYRIRGKVELTSPITMQKILDELRDKKEFNTLSSLLLRSMAKAVYSTDNIGHFGLGSRAYTHFTSPIRRFPDLTVHRLLRKYLFKHEIDNKELSGLSNNLVLIAAHSSEREQAADDAGRDCFDMKVAEYMESHINEEYIATIDTITTFGFYVVLDNLVEGLVHVSTLKGDYFNYVPELLAMVGKSTKKMYRLGDKVKVKCVAASKENSTVDFVLVEDGEEDGNKE